MKYLITFLLVALTACSGKQYPKAENALDAGREFVDACLKGDFEKATFYMLVDDANKNFLTKIEKEYRQKDRDGRNEYRQASINISGVEEINEKENIIYYSNSFDKQPKKIKVVFFNNEWKVDFKFTFNPNL